MGSAQNRLMWLSTPRAAAPLSGSAAKNAAMSLAIGRIRSIRMPSLLHHAFHVGRRGRLWSVRRAEQMVASAPAAIFLLNETAEEGDVRYMVAWLLGVPLSVIVLWY